MRSCVRCQASTPTGLRFCNYCGARLGGAAQEEDLVFGSLALKPAPRDDEPYEPPHHLQALPAPGSAPVALARELARTLPTTALQIAGAAGRAAKQVAGKVAAGLQRHRAAAAERSIEARKQEARAFVATAPHAESAAPVIAPAAPGVASPIPLAAAPTHDLHAAYRLYQHGRAAYDQGDRTRAAQLFAEALRSSPPDSPLGQFLRRVLKVRQPVEAPTAVPAPPVARPAAPVSAALAHPSERGPQERPSPRTHGAASFAPQAPIAVPPPPTPGLGVLPGRSKAPTGVARHRRKTPEARRRTAREHAQKLWFRSLPGHGPSRPSEILDQASEGRNLEMFASLAMAAASAGFLALLFF